MNDFPKLRVRAANPADINRQGEFVLYWMTAYRRTTWNFALQRAVDWARELRKPLVVLEALRCGYRWASDRLHQFVVQGMADNQRSLAKRPVLYHPYLERRPGDGAGLIAALGAQAAVIVGDDYPCFFLPRMMNAAAKQLAVRFELVDANGLLPLRAADRSFARAFDFRRFLQRELRPHLAEFPKADPLAGVRLPRLDKLPTSITTRWPAADVHKLADDAAWLAELPIDHGVKVAPARGGEATAQQVLKHFLAQKLSAYSEERNEPEADATSGLSPYLHFGHIAAHQAVEQALARDGWTPHRISKQADGSSTGWWGASPAIEAFLDELVTWREVGFNFCWQRSDYDRYSSLPAWAQQTLAEHAGDPREFVYSLAEFEAAETHDPLWNAAQRQLVREGRIHNYLRMLWGKKILEWSATPQQALAVMIELNNKYGLDGRDPNSYSGIFWVLGRYDRAWGPERPIYGKIRYMSSDNAARKLHVKGYLKKYSADDPQSRLF